MDKNTWIGFLLIAAIIVGFSFINRPSKEELAERQRVQDSIAMVQQNTVIAEHRCKIYTIRADRHMNTARQSVRIAVFICRCLAGIQHQILFLGIQVQFQNIQ